MSIPSAGSSPSNLFDSTQTISQGRKRQRSPSMESDSAASTSSVKRSTTDNSNDAKARSLLTDQPTSTSTSDLNHDLDAYMAGSGALDVPPVGLPPFCHDTTAQPVSCNEKLQIVQKGTLRKMEIGETWFLVSCVWYKRWKKACTGEVDKEGPATEEELGPVNNLGLLDTYGNLLRSLAEGVDVEYVPEEVWNLFEQWYGVAPHPLSRKVIARGISKKASLELYPLQLKVFRMVTSQSEFDTPFRHFTVSAGETITTLCSQLCQAAALTTAQDIPYRIWKLGITVDDPVGIEYPASQLPISDAKIIDSSDKTLEEEGIESDETFIVEFKQSDGWIAEAPKVVLQPVPLFSSNVGFFDRMSSDLSPTTQYKSNFYGTSNYNTMGTSFSKTPSVSLTLANNNKNFMKPLEPGTLGLGNMGNTCFMNSALQCLGHTKELADYFLSGVFENEINRDNPLGMGGAIAEAFGALLTRMWATSGVSTSYSPRDFKIQLQRFAPQFSGYQQHDSQELVAFLLDGLHEDLNRVLKKPYVEKPDWESGGDLELVELARKSWEGYMMRNDSIIVDLFQGQYQSTLVCPECKKVSITFDPFMYLTLPLPVQKKWKHAIFYVPWDLERPHIKVPVEIHRDASFKDLRALLGRWLDAPPENLLTLEIFNNRFYKNLDDTIPVGDMTDNDVIVCFELPCNARQNRTYKRKPTDPAIVPVYFCDAKPPMRSAYYFQSRPAPTLFGYPIVVVIDEEQAKNVEEIYKAIVNRLERWTSNARDLFDWEVDHSTEIDAVQVKINGYVPVESITEIREDGNVVTIESTPPPEGDSVDEKRMIVDVEHNPSSEDPPLRKKGVKQDIFRLRLQVNHKDYGVTFNNYMSTTRWASWEERELDIDTYPTLLRDDDAFYCEFDEDKKVYYFGEGPRPEHALWDRWEPFVHPELEEARKVAVERQNKGISLQDCLEEFTKKEQLGEDDLWYCPQCKKHQQATKKFDLWKAPDVLVVHLKRFSNNRILRDKIDTHVEFPIKGFDLGDAVQERAAAKRLLEQGVDIETLGLGSLDEPLIYDLYAVDEHIGGLGGGHYRAYAENHQTAKWYHFDDSYVTPARASDSVNPNAYLLFYRRRTDSAALGGKPSQSIREASSEPPQGNPDGGLQPGIALPETQLPTPPDEPSRFQQPSTKDLLYELTSRVQPQLLEHNDVWRLRPAGSNAGSSIPSPPADDPPEFEEYPPYPPELLPRSYNLPDAAVKVSPTSSNAADADVDTDHDDDWDPMSTLEVGLPSPNGSYSDIGKQLGWEEIRTLEDSFSDVNGGFKDHIMDHTHQNAD